MKEDKVVGFDVTPDLSVCVQCYMYFSYCLIIDLHCVNERMSSTIPIKNFVDEYALEMGSHKNAMLSIKLFPK